MRWSVTRPCGKLYVRMRSERSPEPTWSLRDCASALSRFSRSAAIKRAFNNDIARERFLCCERSSWHSTTMPVGRCVMRIAESVLLTCWPPAPDARNVSMRSSAGLSSTASISSSSGRIATVHGRRVDAALRFGRGHALDAMRARLELEVRERASADDAADDFLVAAVLAGALRQHFDAPALHVGIARIHAKQIAGENRRLIAARARAHFQVDVAVVARILRQQQLRELFFLALQPRVETGQLFAAELAQLVVCAFRHFLRAKSARRAARDTRDSA